MPAPRPPARPEPAPQLSMRDLLASCAAAKAISTPPPAPDPVERGVDHRKAA
ncbi:hypothetical protein [Streptomyces bauhiniae]